MNLCINPDCPQPKNSEDNLFCQACGSELLLEGCYRVVRLLSDKGGLGNVYEVSHRGVSKLLKVLINNQFQQVQAKAVELLQREARVLKQLQHPGIPRVENYFIFYPKKSQTLLHCLVMEGILGINLEEYQKNRDYRPIDDQELVLDWLQQLANILGFIHGQPFFHEDIQPSNIILKPDGQLVLIDFGAVREITSSVLLPKGSNHIYTTGYAAPEQKEVRAVPQSDFYALGRTFVYLLTGYRPTDPKIYNSGQDTINWRPHAPGLSGQLADFIDCLMERKADDRPKNTREILQTLARIKLDLYPPPLPPVVGQVPPTVPSRLPTVSSRPPRASRRNFITIASFTAIGAVAKAFGRPKLQSILSTPEKVPTESQPVSVEPIPEPEPQYLLSRFEFQAITVNDIGQEIDRQRHSAEFFVEDLGNGIILEMVSIPGGTFMMGSPDSEKDRDSDETPQHRVKVPGFFMGKYQVTQAQWQAVMDNNPSYFKGEDLPVELVTWYSAEEFCKKLSQKTGRAYRLPSEAEWEYACRAGTTTPFHFGATITTDLANYKGNYTYEREPRGKYREQTTPVGNFPANAFGLYDLPGNVWEWCQDAWHDNYQGAPTDGSARVANKKSGDLRVLRGGSWFSLPGHCRGACRSDNGPAFKRWDSGFRVVLSSARAF